MQTGQSQFSAVPELDPACRARQAAAHRRQFLVQAAVLAVVFAVLYWLAGNVVDNLEQRNIRSGFEFLKNASNIEIGEASIAFTSSDSVARAFFVGLLNTLKVSFFAVISATVLGIIVGLMRLAAHPILRLLGTAHVEFYRNIPLIIQLFAIYLLITELLPMSTDAVSLGGWALLSKAGLQVAVPKQALLSLTAAGLAGILTLFLVRLYALRNMTGLMANLTGVLGGFAMAIVVWLLFGWLSGWSKPVIEGFSIEGGAALSPEFLALWLGLTLFTSASIAEIVRAGVIAVPPGQWNAGLALGMTRMQTVSYVIFPQSMKLAVPPLASQYMNLTKNSSLAVVIGYPDLVAIGNSTINITGQALEVILLIMAVYLTINLVISILMNALNARVTRTVR